MLKAKVDKKKTSNLEFLHWQKKKKRKKKVQYIALFFFYLIRVQINKYFTVKVSLFKPLKITT